MKKFNVISSNPSNEGKTFVTKLHAESTVNTVFGTKLKKETYYVSGSKQLEIGTEVELDLATWNVVERPFELNGEIIMCKWLHLGNSQPVAKIASVVEQA